MSSLCDNSLKLTGDGKFLKKLFESITKEQKFFEFIHPIPKNINESTDSYCRTEWGPKWDCIEVEVEDFYSTENTSVLILRFFTDGTPPIGIYKKLVEMGIQVEGFFIQPEMYSYGFFDNENGIRVEEYTCVSDFSEKIIYEFGKRDLFKEELEWLNED